MRRIVLIGLAIWLAATVALRLWGQHLFDPDRMASFILLLGCSIPLMAWLPRRIFARQSIPPSEWAAAAIALAAPGMLLDTLSTVSFSVVFPNIRPDAAALFGAWLLLCNATALISAALPQVRK